MVWPGIATQLAENGHDDLIFHSFAFQVVQGHTLARRQLLKSHQRLEQGRVMFFDLAPFPCKITRDVHGFGQHVVTGTLRGGRAGGFCRGLHGRLFHRGHDFADTTTVVVVSAIGEDHGVVS